MLSIFMYTVKNVKNIGCGKEVVTVNLENVESTGDCESFGDFESTRCAKRVPIVTLSEDVQSTGGGKRGRDIF